MRVHSVSKQEFDLAIKYGIGLTEVMHRECWNLIRMAREDKRKIEVKLKEPGTFGYSFEELRPMLEEISKFNLENGVITTGRMREIERLIHAGTSKEEENGKPE